MNLLTFSLCIFLMGVIAVNTQKGSVSSRMCKNKYDCGGSFGYRCSPNQTCFCEQMYILNIYGDKCVGGVGQRCRYDEHCIEGAFCEFQITCQCKDNFFASEDGLACSPSTEISSYSLLSIILVIFFYKLLL